MTHFQSSVDNAGAVARVNLDAGVGWHDTSAPDTVLALVKTAPPGTFEPNVAVFVTRHSSEFDARQIIDDLDPALLDIPDLATREPFEVTFNGVHFVGKAVAFRDAVAGTLAQVHLVTKIVGTDASEVVHLVGTCAGARVSVDLPELKNVMATVGIDVDG